MSGQQEKLAALLASEHVTPATRRVLAERMRATFGRRFFTAEEFTLLQALAVRLVPHDPDRFDLAGSVDSRLTAGHTDGWRYAGTPPDGPALHGLLAALPRGFAAFAAEKQDGSIRELEHRFPHVFEDLLAELTETYYSQPEVQAGIGCISFADAPRWTRIGLNEREAREDDFPAPGGDGNASS